MTKKRNNRQQAADEADDLLSEDHTIADSLGTMESSLLLEDSDGAIEDEDFLESGSDHDVTGASSVQRHYLQLQTALEGLEEYAGEKRAVKREAWLRRVFHGLTHAAHAGQFVTQQQQHVEPLRMACLHALRTGPPTEQYTACRVIEVLSLLVLDEDWSDSWERSLRRVMETKATAVRIAALRAYSVSVWMHAVLWNASERGQVWMTVCEAMAASEWRNQPQSVALRAAAWECWGLVSTALSAEDMADTENGRGVLVLDNLCDALEEPGLRSAAGECLALIHQARWQIVEGERENVTARQFHRGSWEGTQWEGTMVQIQQRISELSKESGYTLSKKAKKQQRMTFRELATTLVDEEDPLEVVQFRNGAQLELKTWEKIVQLNFVRHCLQGGFQFQLHTNPTLQSLFGLDDSVNQKGNGYSQVEKRLLLSKTSEASKLQDQKRIKERKKRENIKNDFLGNEN